MKPSATPVNPQAALPAFEKAVLRALPRDRREARRGRWVVGSGIWLVYLRGNLDWIISIPYYAHLENEETKIHLTSMLVVHILIPNLSRSIIDPSVVIPAFFHKTCTSPRSPPIQNLGIKSTWTPSTRETAGNASICWRQMSSNMTLKHEMLREGPGDLHGTVASKDGSPKGVLRIGWKT